MIKLLVFSFVWFALITGCRAAFTKTPQNTTGVVGGNVTLTCKSDSPDPLLWFKLCSPSCAQQLVYNVTISSSFPRCNVTTADGGYNLVITSLQTSDGGTYSCQESNGNGTLATITVQSPTTPPPNSTPSWLGGAIGGGAAVVGAVLILCCLCSSGKSDEVTSSVSSSATKTIMSKLFASSKLNKKNKEKDNPPDFSETKDPESPAAVPYSLQTTDGAHPWPDPGSGIVGYRFLHNPAVYEQANAPRFVSVPVRYHNNYYTNGGFPHNYMQN